MERTELEKEFEEFETQLSETYKTKNAEIKALIEKAKQSLRAAAELSEKYSIPIDCSDLGGKYVPNSLYKKLKEFKQKFGNNFESYEFGDIVDRITHVSMYTDGYEIGGSWWQPSTCY